jgi:T5SS/PEP-CTERM-associated repeat protein
MANFTWKGGNGSFGDANQWNESGGPPGPTDDAQFLVGGTVTGDGSVADILINAATTFASANISASGAIDIGNGGIGVLIAEGASTVTAASATLGTGSGDYGALIIVGSTFSDNGLFTIGDAGGASVTVLSAGTLSTEGTDVGAADGSTGTVTVSGTGSNWTESDNVTVGDGGAGTVSILNGGTDVVVGNLILGNQSTGVGNYTLTGNSGALNVNFNFSTESPNGALIVGQDGVGNFTQGSVDDSDATNTVSVAGDLVLGAQAGSIGNYTLNDGTLTVGGKAVVGASSTSANIFTQNGGLLQITGDASSPSNYVGVANSSTGVLDIGGTAGLDNGNGTYVMTGGSLETLLVEVGHSGTGELNQTGGDVDLASGGGLLWIANSTGARGTYNLSGSATVEAGSEVVGIFGTGTFNQSDSSANTVSGVLSVAGSAGSGTYNLFGGTLTTDGTIVGNNDGDSVPSGTGMFNQIGGQQTIGVSGVASDDLVVGANAGANGTFNLGDASAQLPSLTIYGDTIIGRDAADPITSANAAVGSMTVAGDGTNMSVFQYSGFDSAHGGNMVVGDFGSGSFIQKDQTTIYLDHDLVLGTNENAIGTYTLSGTVPIIAAALVSAASVASSTNLTVGGDLDIGGMLTDVYGTNFQTTELGGTGSFIQTSGAAQVIGALNLGNNAGTGTYDMNGGGLTVGSISIGNNGGDGTFDQSGGIVQVAGNYSDSPPSVEEIGATGTGTYSIAATHNDVHGFGIAPVLSVIGDDVDVGVGTGSFGYLTIGTGGLSATAAAMDPARVYIFANAYGDGGNLTIGDAGGGTLHMESGALSVQNNLNIGVNGEGTVIQDGGTISAGFVDMSVAVGTGSSTYTINGGTLEAGALNLGGGGPGPAVFAENGGTVSVSGDLTINSGATYDFAAGALSVSSSMTDDGGFQLAGEMLNPGSLAIGSDGELTGFGIVSSTIDNDGVIVAKGGTLDLADDVSGSGSVQIALNSTLELGGAFSETVQFTNADVETLIIDDLANFTGTIDVSQAVGVIDFANVVVTSAVVDNGVLTVQTADNQTYDLNITGAPNGSYTPSGDNGSGSEIVICFYPGTQILTPAGERAVEELQAGDLVTTSDGKSVSVRWLGRQTVSTRFADPLRVLPIRIKAGALADELPVRDLLVSPDHALLIGDVLVQAGALVNGTSIVREVDVPERFTYYHVELDDHSLILAENTPAETFIDHVSRLAFDNWDEHSALFPTGNAIVEMPYPRAKAHRQVPRWLRAHLSQRGDVLCLVAGFNQFERIV